MKCYLVDVAGSMDTSGPFIDLVNCMVIKYIFDQASSVKFICPITIDEINESKGKGLRDLIDQLQIMCDSHIVNYVNSFIPVITKCKTNGDYDLEMI